jgi:hypothetical protein
MVPCSCSIPCWEYCEHWPGMSNVKTCAFCNLRLADTGCCHSLPETEDCPYAPAKTTMLENLMAKAGIENPDKCIAEGPLQSYWRKAGLGAAVKAANPPRIIGQVPIDAGYHPTVQQQPTRKDFPIGTVMREYFPLAIAYLAYVCKKGNDQHNPGQPLHWARDKSTDHIDCIPRHLLGAGTPDTDGVLHSGKLFWRAAANLQLELEAAGWSMPDA